MYLARRIGKTSAFQRAQCGQLAEAYSTTCTLALGAPRLMSSAWATDAPSSTGLPQPPSARAAIRAAATRERRAGMRTESPLGAGVKPDSMWPDQLRASTRRWDDGCC